MQCSCPQCLSPLLAEGGQNFYKDYIDDLDDFVDNDNFIASKYLNQSKYLNIEIKTVNNYIENYYQPNSFQTFQNSKTFFQKQSKPFIKEFQLLRYRPIKFNDKSLSLFQPR